MSLATRHRQSGCELLEPRRMLASTFSLGSIGFDAGYQIAPTNDGHIIVAGQFQGTVDFDPGPGVSNLTANGETNLFVAKYTASGALVWARRYGGATRNFDPDELAVDPRRVLRFPTGVGSDPLFPGQLITGVATDQWGNVFITGGFRGRAEFQGRVVETSDSEFHDIFLAKLTSQGNIVWFNRMGGPFTDMANGIALGPDGSAYITGLFTRFADFNPTSTVERFDARGRADIFVARYSTNGKLLWVRTAGSAAVDRDQREAGESIAVDGQGNAYIAGVFSDVALFGPGRNAPSLRSAGGTDAFVAKYDADGAFQWARRTGGRENDGNKAIALGPGGTLYTAGYFGGTADVDPGPGTLNFTATPERPGRNPRATDIVLSKLTPDGQLIWARQLRGTGFETIGQIATNASGDVYLAGGFYGTMDVDPGPNVFHLNSSKLTRKVEDRNARDRSSSYDAFVVSLSTNGRFLHARSLGVGGDDFARGIALDNANRVWMTGRFEFSPGFGGTTLTSRGTSDAFVVAMDEALEVL
jgi:hypothetical protein